MINQLRISNTINSYFLFHLRIKIENFLWKSRLTRIHIINLEKFLYINNPFL